MAETLDRATLSELLQAVGDDPEFITDLVDTYLADGPPMLAQMRAAVAAGSAADLVQPAHALKGSSLSIGATQLAALCAELEHQARAGSLDGGEKALSRLEVEYAAVVAALDSARTAGWVA